MRLKLFSHEPKREQPISCVGEGANSGVPMELYWQSGWGAAMIANHFRSNALSRMHESKPRHTGPMIMQPIDRGATMPVPVLPEMPGPTTTGAPKKPLPKAKLTRFEAVRLVKAKITRRNSLRMQRIAQRG